MCADELARTAHRTFGRGSEAAGWRRARGAATRMRARRLDSWRSARGWSTDAGRGRHERVRRRRQVAASCHGGICIWRTQPARHGRAAHVARQRVRRVAWCVRTDAPRQPGACSHGRRCGRGHHVLALPSLRRVEAGAALLCCVCSSRRVQRQRTAKDSHRRARQRRAVLQHARGTKSLCALQQRCRLLLLAQATQLFVCAPAKRVSRQRRAEVRHRARAAVGLQAYGAQQEVARRAAGHLQRNVARRLRRGGLCSRSGWRAPPRPRHQRQARALPR